MRASTSRRLVCLLALVICLLPILALAGSQVLPVPGDFSYSLSGDSEGAYINNMQGELFRFRLGQTALEALPLQRPHNKNDDIIDMCSINGGVYYLYSNNMQVLQLVYAEQTGLPETIHLPVARDIKGANSNSYIQHLVFDGQALWFALDSKGNDSYVLCQFDLKQGKVKAFDASRGLYGFALLPEGRVALGFNMYEKEKVFGRLSVLDTAGGKTSHQVDIAQQPEAMAFDESSQALLYVSESKLWSWPLAGQPRMLREMPVSGNGVRNPGILMEGKLLSAYMNGLFLADPHEVSAGSLHILGEWPGFDYWGGGYDTFMTKRPDVNLSSQKVVDQNQQVHTGELGQRIQTGMLPFDVMLLNTQEYDLDALINKGYCLDLSGEADMVAAVSSMHPAIAQAVMRDGKLYALPLNVGGLDNLQWSEPYARQAGLKLPTSFEGLVDWAADWPQELRDEIKPLFTTNQSELLKAMFIRRFFAYSYSQHGALDFTDPLFVGILNQIDSRRLPTYPEQMPAAIWSVSSGLLQENLVVLPLTEGGRRVMPARMGLYFINSQSENKELALSYLRNALENSKPENRAALYPAWTQPVENTDYAEWLAETQKETDLLQAAVNKEGRDTPARRNAQERLDAHLSRIEEQRSYRQYKVSPQALVFYQQQIAPYLFFPPINPFTSPREPGWEAIDREIQRYIKGQMSAQALADSLQQKSRLMMLEGEE